MAVIAMRIVPIPVPVMKTRNQSWLCARAHTPVAIAKKAKPMIEAVKPEASKGTTGACCKSGGWVGARGSVDDVTLSDYNLTRFHVGNITVFQG